MLEESGKATSIASFRGKPVIIDLWSARCEPSLFLPGEMGQLQEKAAKYGSEVLPVDYDPERWRTIRAFQQTDRVKKLLKETRLYVPDAGKGGVHLFMDTVPALPVFFILSIPSPRKIKAPADPTVGAAP